MTSGSEPAREGPIPSSSAKPALISKEQFVQENWYNWTISDRAMYASHYGSKDIGREWGEQEASDEYDDLLRACPRMLIDLKFIEAWVETKHGAQRYCGHKNCVLESCPPYVKHLTAVMRLLKEFDDDPTLLAAALLHDILEDTDCTEQELLSLGILPETIRIVKLVTNPKEGNRAAKHAATYPAIKASYGASLLKLCDRIVNIMQSRLCRGDLLDMYKKEHKAFCEALYCLSSCKALKQAWRMYEAVIEGGG